MGVRQKVPYRNHAYRHLPGGSDPIPANTIVYAQQSYDSTGTLTGDQHLRLGAGTAYTSDTAAFGLASDYLRIKKAGVYFAEQWATFSMAGSGTDLIPPYIYMKLEVFKPSNGPELDLSPERSIEEQAVIMPDPATTLYTNDHLQLKCSQMFYFDADPADTEFCAYACLIRGSQPTDDWQVTGGRLHVWRIGDSPAALTAL